MSVNRVASRRAVAGFTLAELLVALALSLIVVGAVLPLVVSMLRTSSETVASIRLTQEARTIGEIVSRELRRTGYDGAFIQFVGRGVGVSGTFEGVTRQATCIQFGYDANGNGIADGKEYKSINFSNGALNLESGASKGAVTCSGGTKLGSSAVTLNNVTFTEINSASLNQQVLLSFEAALSKNPVIKRNFSQVISIRNFSIPVTPPPGGGT